MYGLQHYGIDRLAFLIAHADKRYQWPSEELQLGVFRLAACIDYLHVQAETPIGQYYIVAVQTMARSSYQNNMRYQVYRDGPKEKRD
jgi:hypothetical protein